MCPDSVTTAASPLDVWSPSTNNIKPERGDQVAFALNGYARRLSELTGDTAARLEALSFIRRLKAKR